MVQSVDRTLDILEALASSEEHLSLSQLHQLLRLPLGTVHRLLSTLIDRGYAEQDRETRRYAPGPKLLAIAARAVRNRQFDLQRIARPHLYDLTMLTGETSNLVLLQQFEIVYVDQVMSPRLVRMFTEVGRRLPLYCTGAGKAVLAHLAPDQVEAYLARMPLEPITHHTINTPQQLRRELAQIQEQGFAIDNEEREEGVRCVAAPIFDHTGGCIAAISLSGPTTRLSLARVRELGPRVRQASDGCSAQLGFHVPAPHLAQA